MDSYRIAGAENLITPALAIYPEIVDANIGVTLAMAGGDPNRWRPHVKTAKLGSVMRQMVARGIVHFKCSTTLELKTICENGARDVVVAYPMVNGGARRVRQIRERYPHVRISVLAENRAQAEPWLSTGIGVFIDVNPGMNRTGIDQSRADDISELARALGDDFRGLHYYDGQIHAPEAADRERDATAGYDRLIELASAVSPAEIITSGTPAMPVGLGYEGFRCGSFAHRVSPGTVVYNDLQSLAMFPDAGYRPAALVIASVVSHPTPDRFTCDAGHKSVSADQGVPTCAVLGRPELRPLAPSEEHLPVQVPEGAERPAIGDIVYLVPKHVCPTVNNFDHALIVIGGSIAGVERVDARGHEQPAAGM